MVLRTVQGLKSTEQLFMYFFQTSVFCLLIRIRHMIGSNDLLIAAHAKANNLTLVTNNTNEFERVPDLKIENWIV